MQRTGGWRCCAAAVALTASVGLAACGSDDTTVTESSPSETTSEKAPSSASSSEDSAPTEPAPVPPGTPECSEAWQDGQRLPRFYAGCAEGDTYVERDVLGCSSGQRMVTYADRFYGVLGGTVNEVTQPLDEDPDYTAAIRRCRA